MRTPRGYFLALLPALLSVSIAHAKTPAAAVTDMSDQEKSSVAVKRWLVLGPVVDPLPTFHGEKPGAYDLGDLLKADHFRRFALSPREGAEESWFAPERLRWTTRESGPDGIVLLDRPAGVAEGRPAVAWLAAYLAADSWHGFELELRGTNPRRAWLDGEPIVMGGLEAGGEKPERVSGKAKLATGKHLLLVVTLLDPGRMESWQIGAALNGEKEGQLPQVAQSLEPSRGLDLLDVLDSPQITSVAVSPDGSQAGMTLSRILPGSDDAETWVEVRSTADGGLVQSFRGSPGMSQVAWDPAGRFVSYVTTGKKGTEDTTTSSLWLADLRARSVAPLLEGIESFGGYAWAPDGGVIVFWSSVKATPDKRGVKRLEGLLDRQKDFRTKSYLHLVTVPDGTRRQLTAGSLSATGASFSPDGKTLLFIREVEDFSARPYTRKELWEIDLASFESKKLRDGWWFQSAQYAPDGKRILIQAGPSEFGSAGVKVPEGMIPNEGDGQLYVWDPATSQVDPLTVDFDPSILSAVWSRSDGNIYATAEDHDRTRLYRYDTGTRRFSPLDPGFDVIQESAIADRAPVAVLTGTSPWTPERIAAVDLRSGASRILLEPAKSWFADVRGGTIEPWDFAASDGRTIEGRVYLPAGFDPSRKYPAIVYYYGGTSPVERDFGGRYPKEWWAAQGYVVYVLQPSGATGFGQAFSAYHVNDWGKITSEEVIEGTKKFLEAHPYVDSKRVGCIGASFGGFLTELLVSKSDLFAAAVSHAGISSISSYWGEGYWGYSYSALATAGSFPWNRKDIFVDRSPLFNAENVKTPILLTHGTVDTNVPTGESDTLYTALKLLGVPVEYVQIEGMDHLILDHAKRIVWSRTIVAWFDKWLKGQPGWWDDLYPVRK